MQTLLKLPAVVGLILCANGCATRTVVIDSTADVVRLGPDVKDSVYIFRDGAWVKSGKMQLPEGWYAGPPPK